MAKKVGIAAAALGAILLLFWLWIADRATDLPYPEGKSSGMVFDPRFGPKTPAEARKYVDERIDREWQAHYLRKMRPEDEDSPAGRQERAYVIETLKQHWGITLDMSHDEIDAVRQEAGKTWAYIEQSKTLRHRVRALFGMAK